MADPAGRITTLDHDGLTFDILDEGPLDGDVVVLLHGFPERSTTWRHVAPRLHERGHRTLAMDQRGYSPGARPQRRRDYTMTTLATDAAALVERAGGSAHVVGHDWGAVVGWVLAALEPERVRTLTAISVPHPQAFLSAGPAQWAKSWYIAAFQAPLAPERLASRRGGLFERQLRATGMTREEVARFHTEIVEYGALRGALMWYRAVPFADRRILGRVVRVPTTMVWSDGDAAVDRRSAEGAERMVDAPYELVVVEGASHWLPTQAPDACVEAILRRISR